MAYRLRVNGDTAAALDVWRTHRTYGVIRNLAYDTSHLFILPLLID